MFKVEIETDNAAFDGENLPHETASHLRDIVRKLADMSREDCAVMSNRGTQLVIKDTNGNKIGTARFTDVSEHSED